MAELRLRNPGEGSSLVMVLGYFEPGDGGGGWFFFERLDNRADDGGMIVAPPAGFGRWLRVGMEDARINLRWFGAKGDGLASDYAAFRQALTAAAGKLLYVPAGFYRLDGPTIPIPAKTCIAGDSREASGLRHADNSNMFELGQGSSIKDIGITGNGAVFAGGCFRVLGQDGQQTFQNVSATDFRDAILYFESGAGSQFSAVNCVFARHDAKSGSGQYAVVIDPARQLRAVPRKFSHIETNGQCAFDFGGSNDLFIDSSFIGDVNYTEESRGVLIVSTRIANQQTLVLRGHNNAIVACDIAPQVIIGPGTDNVAFGPNSLNKQPVVDNSGNGRNLIYILEQAFTSKMSSADPDAKLGNGKILSSYSRNGNLVFINIQLSVGSTTELGNGELAFSLPIDSIKIIRSYRAEATVTFAGANREIHLQVADGGVESPVLKISLWPGAGAGARRWTSGDTLRMTVRCVL